MVQLKVRYLKAIDATGDNQFTSLLRTHYSENRCVCNSPNIGNHTTVTMALFKMFLEKFANITVELNDVTETQRRQTGMMLLQRSNICEKSSFSNMWGKTIQPKILKSLVKSLKSTRPRNVLEDINILENFKMFTTGFKEKNRWVSHLTITVLSTWTALQMIQENSNITSFGKQYSCGSMGDQFRFREMQTPSNQCHNVYLDNNEILIVSLLYTCIQMKLQILWLHCALLCTSTKDSNGLP